MGVWQYSLIIIALSLNTLLRSLGVWQYARRSLAEAGTSSTDFLLAIDLFDIFDAETWRVIRASAGCATVWLASG